MQQEETTQLFDLEDRVDWLPGQRPFHGETPSKPPVTGATTKRRPGRHPVGKKVVVQDPEQQRQDERHSSPIPDPLAHLDAMRSYGKEHLDHFQEEQARKEQAAANKAAAEHAPTVSKVPESHETSEDEQPSQAAQALSTKKRPFGELDYDIETLKTMSFSDLDSAAFLSDPRTHTTQVPVDASGSAITLEQRLTNLSRMNTDDQKSLFRSLSDAENEDVGQWFVKSFADDLKRLMEVRLQRRKKALMYELEARKRQREVDTKSADLDAELSELKKGGSQLIEGRSSPRLGRVG